MKKMEIKILGTGCPTCSKLFTNVEEVVSESEIVATVSKIQDIEQILTYDVIALPALVVDDKVVSSGKKLSKDDIKKLLSC